MNQRRTFLICAVAVMAAACSDSSKTTTKEKAPEKPPEPVTGQTAFWKMYTVAVRTWAPDTQALYMQSVPLDQVKAEGGKYPAWQAMMYSASKGQQRLFTYSVIEAGGNLHKDVFANLVETYTKSGQEQPWPVQAFKVDSDKAYQVAVEKSAEYVKKNPNKPVTFLLSQTPRHPDLTWRVIWGESLATSNYSVYVDASTGQFLEKMR